MTVEVWPTYKIVIVGNLARAISQTGELDGPFIGPAITAASTVGRLGVFEMALIGAAHSEWRSSATEDIERCQVQEYVYIERSHYIATEIENLRGEVLPVGIITDRINIRDVPDEFLSSTVILLSPFAEEVDDELIEWMRSSSDATIVLDPSFYRVVRNRAIRVPMDAADARRILRHVDIVTLNEAECEYIVGESDAMVAAELLVNWGVGTSVVTRGAEGSVSYSGDEFVLIPAFDTGSPPKCWTGASFAAGLSKGIADGLKMTDAVALASSVASLFVEQKDRCRPLDAVEVEHRWRHLRGEAAFR